MSSTENQRDGPITKKICVLGASAVGKTSLVRRYVYGIFDEQYKTTIGVTVEKMNVMVDGQLVTLMIWDVEGYDDPLKDYKTRKTFIDGTEGYVLVVDGTRPGTYEMASTIQQLVQEQLTPQQSSPTQTNGVPFVAIVNKCDLGKANDFHVEGWAVYKASAKTGDNVLEAFETLVRQMLQVDRFKSECGGETLRLEGEAGVTGRKNYDLSDPPPRSE